MTRRQTRRSFLKAAGLGAAGLLTGCAGRQPAAPGPAREAVAAAPTATPAPVERPPTPSPSVAPAAASIATPTPTEPATVIPPGQETRPLMAGTRWETQASVRATGVAGAALVVLGGVHGNEPGGWLAADVLRDWIPSAGVLIVVPHANVQAISAFARLIEGEGDLNRSYPGSDDSEIPMERLASAIIGLATEFGAELLLDLHESWAHYVDRSEAASGTAFLGQTVTGGVGPRMGIAQELADAVNPSLASERDLLIPRDGRPFARGGGGGRSRSSLALGGHVPGLTPVLVEMAQQETPVERRVEMHLAVVRAAMDILGI